MEILLIDVETKMFQIKTMKTPAENPQNTVHQKP